MSIQHEEKNTQNMPVQMMPMKPYDNEISLLELWRTLMRRKWIIFGTTFFSILAGVGYAMLTTPVYETKVYFSSPTIEDIEELNINNITRVENKTQYDPEFVYNIFLHNLQSRELRRKFFKQEGLLSVLTDGHSTFVENDIFEKKFNEVLVLKENGGKKDKILSFNYLRFEGKDSIRIADLTNNFFNMVMKDTRDQLIKEVITLKYNQIKDIEKSISSKRKVGIMQKEDFILRLKEALDIATNLKVTEDKFSGSDVDAASTYNVQVAYLRGTKTLGAQIKSLQNRKDDDPFIPGLRELQEKLDSISTTVIIPDHIQVAKIDQPALVPDKPIKPKKGLVVALAGGGGLFLGIFTAFFLGFVQKVRREKS